MVLVVQLGSFISLVLEVALEVGDFSKTPLSAMESLADGVSGGSSLGYINSASVLTTCGAVGSLGIFLYLKN